MTLIRYQDTLRISVSPLGGSGREAVVAVVCSCVFQAFLTRRTGPGHAVFTFSTPVERQCTPKR